jgi:O-antigen/teichoic acid export membrane protein
MSRLLRGASITLAARLLALLLGVASSVILARALGPAGSGEYALIALVPALFLFTGGLGLEHAVTFLVAKRRNDTRSIVFTLAAASGVLGLLLLAVYTVLSAIPAYDRFLTAAAVDPTLVWVLILLLPVVLATQIFTSAVLGLEQYRAYNLATLVNPTVNLIMLLVLVAVLELGVAGAVAAAGSASLFALAASAAFFGQLAPPGPTRWATGLLRDALAYGVRVYAANVAWFVHYRGDMFLVAYFVGPVALGFYATAVGLAEKLNLAPSAVGTVLFPTVASAGAATARSVTPRASRNTLWLTLCFAVILAALAWPLVYALFGRAFLPSVPLLWLLLPGVVSLSVGRVLSADLNGRGLPGAVARVNGAMAVVNLALNLWWIPIWGAAGGAAAASLSYTAAVLLLARRYRLASGASWRELLVLDRSDGAVLARALGTFARRDTRRGGTQLGPDS